MWQQGQATGEVSGKAWLWSMVQFCCTWATPTGDRAGQRPRVHGGGGNPPKRHHAKSLQTQILFTPGQHGVLIDCKAGVIWP